MMKRVWFFGCFGIMFCNFFTASSYADIELFESKCLGCHGNGDIKAIDLSERSASAWERFFKDNNHPVDLSKKITQIEMQKLLTFFKTKSAGTEQPVFAVIPKHMPLETASSTAVEYAQPAAAIIPK